MQGDEASVVTLQSSTDSKSSLMQGGQDILSMMGQLMKPKKTEITGRRTSVACEQGSGWRALHSEMPLRLCEHIRPEKMPQNSSFFLIVQSLTLALVSGII